MSNTKHLQNGRGSFRQKAGRFSFLVKSALCRVAATMILLSAPLLARAGGDEVVVVYNTRVPESKTVADHYAQVRDVPTNQIFGFPLTSSEQMSRAEFRDSLQSPLAKKIEADGLWELA